MITRPYTIAHKTIQKAVKSQPISALSTVQVTITFFYAICSLFFHKYTMMVFLVIYYQYLLAFCISQHYRYGLLLLLLAVNQFKLPIYPFPEYLNYYHLDPYNQHNFNFPEHCNHHLLPPPHFDNQPDQLPRSFSPDSFVSPNLFSSLFCFQHIDETRRQLGYKYRINNRALS